MHLGTLEGSNFRKDMPGFIGDVVCRALARSSRAA
jgi:hypothetical protein